MDTSRCQGRKRESIAMPTTLQIASRLQITPLLDIHHPPFAKLYRDGVYLSLFKKRCTGPLSDRYLLENLRASLTETDVDGQQAHWLPLIGFHFGRLHGTILSSQTGKPRSDVTALASFRNDNAARGYHVGREYYFIDAQHDERTYTDGKLIERLQELECDSGEFHEGESTWYYALGCILGELSGQLFPATPQEYERWETDRRFWQAQCERTSRQEAGPEPVSIVTTVP
jgi:hypothetical protein